MRPKKSFVYANTRKIIAASELIRNKYLEIGLAPEKVTTIYQGIKIPSAVYHSPSVGAIGIVGRLDPVKGHKYFLEAAAIVLKKYPEARFLVAGKEENVKYSDLKRIAVEMDMEKSVEFCGFVEDVSEFMSRCSVGVIASTGSEAVSRVLLEWMGAGKPVISTSVGCIPEILGEEFLVLPNAPVLLAEKIIGIIQDKQKIANAGKNNLNTIKDKFSFEGFVSQTEKVFYEAIKDTSH